MKNELIASFVEGFKDSFRLAACLFMAVASVIAAFTNRERGEPDPAKKREHLNDPEY